MRVAFIQKDPLPDPVFMALAAAAVFQGHQVTTFIPAAERNLTRALRRFAPDALLFAPHGGTQDWATATARRLQRVTGGAPSLFAGSHAEDHPELAGSEGVDLVLVGDPETTLPELLTKLERGHGKARQLPGTAGTIAQDSDGNRVVGADRRPTEHLDELPLADLEIYRRYPFVRNQTTLPFTTGRGSLENTHADFCIGPAELKRRFRKSRRHSVKEAIHRLHLHIQRRPLYRRVAFRDDSLLMDPLSPDSRGDDEWLHSFLEVYAQEIQLPFSCVGRADLLSDERIARLAEAGCDRMLLGVDSGDSELRRALYGRDISDDQIVHAGTTLKRRGVTLQTVTFLGLRGETATTAQAGLELNLRLAPAHAFAILAEGWELSPLGTETERFQLLFPLAVRFPRLRGRIESLLDHRSTATLQRLFQLHHDAAFVTSGELPAADILRIAANMKRNRNTQTLPGAPS